MLQKIKKVFHHADMFCSSEMLRYNSDTQYKTLTGGLFSISIIVVIIVGFASMISDTLNRTSITSTVQTIKRQNPTLFELKPGSQDMFMFGLGISSIDMAWYADLASGPRYFDIFLSVIRVENAYFIESTSITMEKCTPEHWKMMPSVASSYDSLGVNTWLCPPLNATLPLQGASNSPVNLQILIGIQPCKNSSAYDRPCAPQAQIDSLFETYRNFYFTINYINPVINPNQPDHIDYYLQGNDYVIFSNIVGAEAWIYFSDYTINTDNSIWPFEQNIAETGAIVEQKSINHPFSVHQNTAYAYIYLAKSVNSLIYTRSVQKVSAVLSYIGGLVGAITAVLFLIKAYTDTSLEVMIGIQIFDSKAPSGDQKEKGEKQPEQKLTFNFFKYIVLGIYGVLKSFGIRKAWPTFNKLSDYQKQINNQLDIKSLLKRLINLQKWMISQMEDYHIEGLKYQQPLSCSEAKRLRMIVLQKTDENIIEEDGPELSQNCLHKVKNEERTMKIVIQNMQINSGIGARLGNKSIDMNSMGKDKEHERQNYEFKDLSANIDSEIIPVSFIKEPKHIVRNSASIADYEQNMQKMCSKSIVTLKNLYKNIENDKMSRDIWKNLRAQVKQKILQTNQS